MKGLFPATDCCMGALQLGDMQNMVEIDRMAKAAVDSLCALVKQGLG